MKKLFLHVLLLSLFAASVVFAGGNRQTPAEPAATPAPQAQAQTSGPELVPVAPGLTVVNHGAGEWEVGTRGGRMVMGQLGEGPKTFNLVQAAETSTTDITDMLGAQLARRNQFSLEYEPFMAESWTVSADEKTVTVKLRPGLVWSDGTPITAKDWVDGFTNIIYNEEVQTNSRDAFFIGESYAVWTYIDDRTLSLTVSEVYAGLTGALLETSPLPMHILGPIMESQGAEGINTLWGIDTDPTKIPSSGPFVISSFSPSERITLRRNPNYFERDAAGVQLPYLDELIFVFTPDQDTLLQNFLAGQSDFLGVRGADYASLVDQQQALGFTLYEVGSATSTQFITFNQNPNGISGPFLEWNSNKDFRTAMAHLIDRETIINNVEFGFGYPQYSFIPTFSPYYWEGVEDIAIEYDPVTAAEILDRIGYVDRDGDGIREDDKGNKISLTLETNAGNRVREAIGTIFAQEAANVGIEINFRPIDFNVLVGKLTATFDWDLILIGLTGSIDPISGANVYPSRGNLHMIEPNQESPRRDWEKRVDDAWIVANNTTNEAQRVRGYQVIQEIWATELPWVYTYTPLVMHAYASKFGNIYPQPTEGYDWKGIIARMYVK
ncbi:MAG: ABC transporter substrate-binding protein [Spirochaetales bacterium]|nr:ABC transporter substrate-binding protein [Spirochaetales bacterium]